MCEQISNLESHVAAIESAALSPPRKTSQEKMISSLQIKLIRWNASELSARREELASFLHLRDIDVALISETYLLRHLHKRSEDPELCYIRRQPSQRRDSGRFSCPREK